MTPRELIGTAAVPGGEPLRLFRRGGDIMLVLERNELMNSRMSGSEEPLATLVDDDVAALIAAGTDDYDAILLDVDNGPDGLTRAGNNRLYSARGLDTARAALRPGGVLAIWTAAPDAAFARRLREADFAVEEVAVRARTNGKGPRPVIWFATT